MRKHHKWTIYQIIALILFIISFTLFHQYMDNKTVHPNDTGSLFMLGGYLYIPISWIYITIYFQQEKYPNMMDHRIWRIVPFLLAGVGSVSMIAFIMLASMGSLMEWMEKGSWIFYVFITYASGLYFFFILSIVYKMSEARQQVVHYSYVWSLGVIIAISFIF